MSFCCTQIVPVVCPQTVFRTFVVEADSFDICTCRLLTCIVLCRVANRALCAYLSRRGVVLTLTNGPRAHYCKKNKTKHNNTHIQHVIGRYFGVIICSNTMRVAPVESKLGNPPTADITMQENTQQRTSTNNRKHANGIPCKYCQ